MPSIRAPAPDQRLGQLGHLGLAGRSCSSSVSPLGQHRGHQHVAVAPTDDGLEAEAAAAQTAPGRARRCSPGPARARAPRACSPSRCRFTGRGPQAQPPGRETRASPPRRQQRARARRCSRASCAPGRRAPRGRSGRVVSMVRTWSASSQRAPRVSSSCMKKRTSRRSGTFSMTDSPRPAGRRPSAAARRSWRRPRRTSPSRRVGPSMTKRSISVSSRPRWRRLGCVGRRRRAGDHARRRPA